MTEFLQAIKSDLLSRRLLPFAALVVIGLIAAVGYAAAGGSNRSAPTTSAGGTGSRTGAGALALAVAPANPNQAISETPAGARYQSKGPTRDPFTPLPSPPAAKRAATSASSKSSGSSSTSSSSGGTGGSSAGKQSAPAQAPAPAAPQPTKPLTIYVVSAALAVGPASPGQAVTVTPYRDLKPHEPLPSKKDMRLSFERVTTNAKGAIFKLIVPPILHGPGRCLPSASECQSIDVAAGQVEELEYVEADGQTVIYGLKVVAITKVVIRANAAQAGYDAKAAQAKPRTGRARASK
jgi:hypothetical protein